MTSCSLFASTDKVSGPIDGRVSGHLTEQTRETLSQAQQMCVGRLRLPRPNSCKNLAWTVVGMRAVPSSKDPE